VEETSFTLPGSGELALSRVEVRNFQSVHHADIALGRLTVVTGHTGAGKSALFRALRTLARNARGTDYVSAGQASCSVTAGGQGWVARLTRSADRGKNQYVTGVMQDGAWATETYTKLGGQVPADVTRLLGLTDLNFARQVEAPYLLDVPGTEIARTLGDLTNVSLVLGAAGEAGRTRKRLERELATARARREALLEEAQAFAGLRERRAACTAAEEALEGLQELSGRTARLQALTDRLGAAEAALESARAVTGTPPDMALVDELAAARARVARLASLARGLRDATGAAARLRGEADQAARDAVAAEQAVHAALVEAGQCPVCGSAVTPD
jgi:DNA repair exonuclease SbcCD ATPase subunit